jgi:hypothetical protein
VRSYARFVKTVAAACLSPGPGDPRPVVDADLEGRPEPAQRYLRFMGVVGRPRDWSFRVRFRGRFRRTPTEAWMPCDAWQYNSSIDVARIFVMRLRFAHLVTMVGRDTYVRGHGRMLGTVLGVITVADGQGEEFDVGELVTYLNDAVLLAPSMLLDSAISWAHVDEESFDLTMTDAGHRVSARVFVDERGAPRSFRTTDRYATTPDGLVRAPWTTPIESWSVVDGRPFPGRGGATWHLSDGEFTYIEGGFVAGSAVYNVSPSSL